MTEKMKPSDIIKAKMSGLGQSATSAILDYLDEQAAQPPCCGIPWGSDEYCCLKTGHEGQCRGAFPEEPEPDNLHARCEVCEETKAAPYPRRNWGQDPLLFRPCCDACWVVVTGKVVAAPTSSPSEDNAPPAPTFGEAMALDDSEIAASIKSTREWLASWADGPNWADPTGATVPITKSGVWVLLDLVDRMRRERDAFARRVDSLKRVPADVRALPKPPTALEEMSALQRADPPAPVPRCAGCGRADCRRLRFDDGFAHQLCQEAARLKREILNSVTQEQHQEALEWGTRYRDKYQLIRREVRRLNACMARAAQGRANWARHTAHLESVSQLRAELDDVARAYAEKVAHFNDLSEALATEKAARISADLDRDSWREIGGMSDSQLATEKAARLALTGELREMTIDRNRERLGSQVLSDDLAKLAIGDVPQTGNGLRVQERFVALLDAEKAAHEAKALLEIERREVKFQRERAANWIKSAEELQQEVNSANATIRGLIKLTSTESELLAIARHRGAKPDLENQVALDELCCKLANEDSFGSAESGAGNHPATTPLGVGVFGSAQPDEIADLERPSVWLTSLVEFPHVLSPGDRIGSHDSEVYEVRKLRCKSGPAGYDVFAALHAGPGSIAAFIRLNGDQSEWVSGAKPVAPHATPQPESPVKSERPILVGSVWVGGNCKEVGCIGEHTVTETRMKSGKPSVSFKCRDERIGSSEARFREEHIWLSDPPAAEPPLVVGELYLPKPGERVRVVEIAPPDSMGAFVKLGEAYESSESTCAWNDSRGAPAQYRGWICLHHDSATPGTWCRVEPDTEERPACTCDPEDVRPPMHFPDCPLRVWSLRAMSPGEPAK